MDLSSFGQFISQYGFPIVVAGFLLLRTEPALKELTKAITVLTEKIDSLVSKKEG